MIGHESQIALFKGLPPRELDRELKQKITDSLQELVACVERALPLEADTLHGCVIDDFDIQHVDLADHECRIRFCFVGSVRILYQIRSCVSDSPLYVWVSPQRSRHPCQQYRSWFWQ